MMRRILFRLVLAAVGVGVSPWVYANGNDVVYLVPSYGTRDAHASPLLIGQVAMPSDDPQRPWQARGSGAGLEYFVGKRNVIIMIRCDMPICLTDQNIMVGMSQTDVLRRMGAATRNFSTVEGVLLAYNGVGFEMVRNAVKRIYILP
ncbi:MAG: hypothetical protein OEW08_13490 [Gammaproteobacteria bacterium]|nr:hypothetical protein [Gammaproteobacteria bacterium]